MSIFCDNDPAINVVNGNSPGSNRHMSIRINFVPDVIAHKLVFLAPARAHFVATCSSYQSVDLFCIQRISQSSGNA